MNSSLSAVPNADRRSPGRERLRRLALLAFGLAPWALVVLLTAINLLYSSKIGPEDDAYITYRVARNLASGHGPVFNPGERVLSITTPGYMLLLAAVSPLSDNFVALGLALNGLAMLIMGALLIDLTWRQVPSPSSREETVAYVAGSLAATVAVALTLMFAPLTSAVGMETTLYVAALLAVFAAYRRALLGADSGQKAQRWLAATAVAAAAAFLLRPDGLLAGLVVAGHWLATRRRPTPWPALSLALVLTLPWVLFAWAYYGSAVPNTLAAKSSQALAQDSARWGGELMSLAKRWMLTQPAATLLAAIGLAATVYPWRQRVTGLRTVRRLMLGWAVLYVVIHTALNVRAYFWYYVPLAPVVALLAGDGVRALAQVLYRGLTGAQPASRQAKIGVSAVLVLLALAVLVPPAIAAGRLALSAGPRQRESAYRRTALALRDLCGEESEPGQTVGMAEIGVLGYLSDCPVLDFSGLLQPELAHLRAEPADKMVFALQSYAPPLVVFSGSDNYPRDVAAQTWFRQRYEPADIQDERGFQSVVYRRGPGVPGQRDLSGALWWRSRSPLAGRGLSLSPGEVVTTTLTFPLDASPAITLHVYLPPGSSLSVSANSRPVAELAGEQAAWRDVALPTSAAAEGKVTLQLAAQTAEQPAAVAWIESNALPAVHFFQPLVDLSQRPRPRLVLPPGQSHTVDLAPDQPGPLALELLHRDRPGVALAVLVNGVQVATVGGSDEWRTERVALPPDIGSCVRLELRSQGSQPAELVYATLTHSDVAQGVRP